MADSYVRVRGLTPPSSRPRFRGPPFSITTARDQHQQHHLPGVICLAFRPRESTAIALPIACEPVLLRVCTRFACGLIVVPANKFSPSKILIRIRNFALASNYCVRFSRRARLENLSRKFICHAILGVRTVREQKIPRHCQSCPSSS
jgi:hypothetical protein